MRWGTAKAAQQKAWAYLESTLEAAQFYEHKAFKSHDKISVDLSKEQTEEPLGIYSEIAYLFTSEPVIPDL